MIDNYYNFNLIVDYWKIFYWRGSVLADFEFVCLNENMLLPTLPRGHIFLAATHGFDSVLVTAWEYLTVAMKNYLIRLHEQAYYSVLQGSWIYPQSGFGGRKLWMDQKQIVEFCGFFCLLLILSIFYEISFKIVSLYLIRITLNQTIMVFSVKVLIRKWWNFGFHSFMQKGAHSPLAPPPCSGLLLHNHRVLVYFFRQQPGNTAHCLPTLQPTI